VELPALVLDVLDFRKVLDELPDLLLVAGLYEVEVLVELAFDEVLRQEHENLLELHFDYAMLVVF